VFLIKGAGKYLNCGMRSIIFIMTIYYRLVLRQVSLNLFKPAMSNPNRFEGLILLNSNVEGQSKDFFATDLVDLSMKYGLPMADLNSHKISNVQRISVNFYRKFPVNSLSSKQKYSILHIVQKFAI
jgi:hypothetical protein